MTATSAAAIAGTMLLVRAFLVRPFSCTDSLVKFVLAIFGGGEIQRWCGNGRLCMRTVMMGLVCESALLRAEKQRSSAE